MEKMRKGLPINNKNEEPEYEQLLGKMSATYTSGQIRATRAVKTEVLETYWHIGRHIVEFEQGGDIRAEYGKKLISNLASHQLSWSHLVKLLKIEDPIERSFYEKQSIIEKWSVPQLKRQKNTALVISEEKAN
jgi:hypothetical protein